MGKNNARIPLKPGALCVSERNGNQHELSVESVIAFGGSCIVYSGFKLEQIGERQNHRAVIIKEFYPATKKSYPADVSISRDEKNALCVPDKYREEFEKKRQLFLDGQSKHSEYYELSTDTALDTALPRAFLYGEANNTEYAISDPSAGKTLKEIDRSALSLSDISSIMMSLCRCFFPMHAENLLYLDCKPENIFILDNRAYLFDFDTLLSGAELKYNSYEFCSSSEGWAAPEQLERNALGGYKNSDLIGVHTDIFSIGAVFFWLLTGRNPTKDDLKDIQSQAPHWVSESLCANSPEKPRKRIDRIMKKLLQADVTKRQNDFKHSQSVENLVYGEFEALYKYTLEDRSRLASNHDTRSIQDAIKETERIIRGELSSETEKLTHLISDFQQNLLIQQPGLTVSKQNRKKEPCISSAVTLNRYNFESGNIHLYGRTDELKYLTDMCEASDVLFCWTGIYGAAGTGKSKLTYEWCKHMEAKGWWTVRPSKMALNIAEITEQICNSPNPVLICCDDAKYKLECLEELIYFIVSYPEQVCGKVRLVLIDRDLDDLAWSSADIMECLFLPEQSGMFSFLDDNGFMRLSGLDPSNGKLLLQAYIESTGKTIDDQELSALCKQALQIDEFNRPIYLIVTADIWCDGKSFQDKEKALNYILSRENERILKVIKSELSKKSEVSYYQKIVQLVQIIASFCGDIEIERAEEILINSFHKKVNAESFEWIMDECGLLDDNKAVVAVKPDVLGEYMCVREIPRLTDEEADTLYRAVLSENGSFAVYYMSNIVKDYKKLLTSKKLCIIIYATSDLVYKIGENISLGLSENQLDEFDNIENELEAKEWLENNSPNYRKVVVDSFAQEAEALLQRNTFIAEQGTLNWSCGLVYSGFLFDESAYGPGVLHRTEETADSLQWEEFEGIFEDDEAKNGVLTLSDGTRIEGKWDYLNGFISPTDSSRLKQLEAEYSMLSERGQLQQADELLVEKVNLLQEIADYGFGFSRELFSSLAKLGKRLNIACKYDEALAVFDEGFKRINAAKKADWCYWTPNNHSYFAWATSLCLQTLGRYNEAEKVLEEALATISNENNSLSNRLSLLRSLSQIRLDEGKLDLAEASLCDILNKTEDAFSIDPSLTNAAPLLFNYFAYAEYMRKTGAWQTAKEYLEKSNALIDLFAEDTGKYDDLVRQKFLCYMRIVNDMLKSGQAGNDEAAEEVMNNAVKEIRVSIGNAHETIAAAKEELAAAVLEHGRYKLAIDAFEEAKTDLEEARNLYRELFLICQDAFRPGLAKTLLYCAELYMRTKHCEKAKACCEEALPFLSVLRSSELTEYGELYEKTRTLYDDIMSALNS